MVDRLVAVNDADYRLPEPVRDALAIDVVDVSSGLGSAVSEAVTTGSGVFSAAPFLAADGTTDDTAGLQAAADAAAALGAQLYVPVGDVRLSAPVYWYGAAKSEARFLVDAASTGRIVLTRTDTPVVINPAGVTGLTKGSTQLSGVSGAGTLVIVSSEELIKRWNGGAAGTPYTRQETVRVGTDGSIFPPLDNTYDTAQITSITLYPADVPSTVTGVRVVVDGAVAGSNDNVVTVNRSNVDLDGLQVVNTSGQPQTSGVRVQDAVSVRLLAPRIHGFDLNGAGYGVAKYRSSDITITDAQITQCRHAVTGRYENRVLLLRGFYGGGIDTHWGTGLVADSITSQVVAGGTHFAVAGGTVDIIGGTFNGGRNLVGIRSDTPEAAGLIDVRGNWRWTCDASTASAPTPWVVGYSTLNDGGHGYYFGHILAAPSVRVRDGVITLPTARVAHVFNVGAQSFQRNHFPTVEVDNVRLVNPGTRFGWVVLTKSATTLPDTGPGTAVTVRRMTAPVANDAGVSILNEADAAAASIFTVLVEDSTNVAIKVPEQWVSSVVVRRSRVIQVQRPTASANLPANSNKWAFEFCDFAAPSFNGYWAADFAGCTWSRAVTNAQAPVNSRVKSYLSNKTEVGASGIPTVGDPYRNSTYYSV